MLSGGFVPVTRRGYRSIGSNQEDETVNSEAGAGQHGRGELRVDHRLIADAEAASRVHEPIALGEGDEKEGWPDAQAFWGGP
jgi:hypothetical protein